MLPCWLLVGFRSKEADLKVLMLDCRDVITLASTKDCRQQLRDYVTMYLNGLGLGSDAVLATDMIIVVNKCDTVTSQRHGLDAFVNDAAQGTVNHLKSSVTAEGGQATTSRDVTTPQWTTGDLTSQRSVCVVSCSTGEGMEDFVQMLKDRVKSL